MGEDITNYPGLEMGIFDIDGEVYYGQEGKQLNSMDDFFASGVQSIDLVYLHFADKYWLATRLFEQPGENVVMGLIDREGKFNEIKWLSDWPDYYGITVLTRKGLFWSGRDYRLENPGPYDKGAYLQRADGLVYKVVQGQSFDPVLSNDGCSIAFYNISRYDRDDGSLKVFRICESDINAKELQNVNR